MILLSTGFWTLGNGSVSLHSDIFIWKYRSHTLYTQHTYEEF